MEYQKRLSDYSDKELAGLTNQQIKAIAKQEYQAIKNDPSKADRAKSLRDVVEDIDNGTYENPFLSPALTPSTRSPIKAVRAARVITTYFEIVNRLVSISLFVIFIVIAFSGIDRLPREVVFVNFVISGILPVFVYFVLKYFYVVLELIADIADDVRRIRLQGE